MEMANVRLSRPIAIHYRSKYGQLAIASLGSALVLFAALAFATESVGAQSLSATPGFENRGSIRAEVGTVVRPILALKKIGDPVLLDDGRYEQRYQVTANVLFRLQSSAERIVGVRCVVESLEVPLAEYAGVAGFQTDVRVRSADPAALDVSAQRLTSVATAQSGR